MPTPKYAILQDTGKITYLTEKETSEVTRKALSTLRNDRHLRRGLPYVKDGKSIRYNLSDVIAYMESRKVCFDG